MPLASAARNPATQAPDQYLTVSGIRLRFRDEGAGPAVVLLHGWTLDLEMWDPQVARLRQAFRLVRLDRRGHGLSGGTPSPEHDAADVTALCRRLGLNRVGVIGMSQGARSALALAGDTSVSVAAILLDGPPSFDRAGPEDVSLEHFRLLVRNSGMPAFRREWLHHPLTQLHTEDPQTRALLRAMIERFAGNELADGASRNVPPTPLLPRLLSAPVLILTGELDAPSRIRSAERLSAALPRAELTVIKGAGHLPNLDRPNEYSEVCRGFFDRHMRAHSGP
jgi:pimeloyl-ACP methyl ester carboxylesterase